jgi:HK97 gp10 family phage protein
MSVKISVSGVKEIDRVLKGLPRQLQDRVLAAAHRDAAKPLVNAMKAGAPKGSGTIAKNIGTSKVPKRSAAVLGETDVGPKKRGYVARFVERGTKARVLKGKGKYPRGTGRGKINAKPFLEPAFNATKEAVINGISESVGKKLLSFMKRTIKK